MKLGIDLDKNRASCVQREWNFGKRVEPWIGWHFHCCCI